MTSLTAVTAVTVPAITWQQAKVITTEMLARLYGAEEESIRKNFSRNAERFEEGKHYFKLEGELLKNFKNCVPLSHAVPKHTRSLTLWTERGAARHAKMLETEQAWDVFEALEDNYFRADRVVVESPEERARLRHATAGIHKAMNEMLVRRRTRDGKECAKHHFMNEAKLINHVLLGAFKGVDRDSLNLVQLDMLAKLEAQNMMLLAEGVSYADRKKQLEQFALDLAAASRTAKKIIDG
jgi:hypothetical protein